MSVWCERPSRAEQVIDHGSDIARGAATEPGDGCAHDRGVVGSLVQASLSLFDFCDHHIDSLIGCLEFVINFADD
jgi:hypothetical protein